ncbi:SusC/RagA family TonB-linked outer membrane protein [Robertkochia solimangrovi]|uniref:SusC/RagA family TonB-linked outer membrane protein n=1 Tax=Robertkochia solimangrovi TaxID=2213046 RepID=UPI0011809507|nr:TonB-dependent receptor [Robertkochia solimangrovi]TRZ45750.1 SusC/RagA family TonB-linked outer membrane protein [Robertkochia solimangrovi]
MNTINHKWRLQSVMLFRILILLIMLFGMGFQVQAQEKINVSGTIYDGDGEVLPGASVIETGTSNGITTDFDGNFSLLITPGNSIEVSYIGFITQTLVIEAATSTLVITLNSDTVSLDAVELVAVGYGTMRKSDLTGAISTVSSDDLVKGVISSTEQVLQGKVAGLTVVQGTGDPSSGATLRLRGGTSLTASNNPLIVVDGIPGVDINAVQPSDIASIDVLKDASATAIYGSRGANGVIIITTKGQGAGTSVTYTGLSGVSYASNHIDMLSANQWRDYVRTNGIQDAIDFGGNTDWQKELEQTAYTQSHTLSFTNGKEDSGLRASLSFLDNEGIVQTTGLERLSANISTYQYALQKKLKFDVGLFANIDKWHPLDYRIFERAFNLNPTIPVYDQNGEFTEVGGTLYENPVEILTNRVADDKRHRLLGYFKTELEFLPDFKAVVNLSLEHNAHTGSGYKPSYAVMEGRTEGGYANKNYDEYTNMQLESYITYTKEIGDHNINAMVGYSFLENRYEGFGAQRSGFETDLFEYNNLGAGQDYRLGDVYSYKGKSNLVSLYARANYSYDSKYMFTATIRRDGSSRFGANNKWGVFPSASVAWRISSEDFMEGTSVWLNTLKLRVGYGVTGNQDGIGEYRSLSILGVGNDSYYDAASDTWKLAYSPTQNPNPDLKWESTEQTNIGLDFGLFGRITGSLEWYYKYTNDLLYTYEVPQPPYLVGTMLANVGELSNTGVELTLNANIIDGDKFTWDANLNLSHNKQVIEKLSNQVYETDIIYSGSLHGLSGFSNQFSQVIREGYPVGTFWGLQSEGLDENGAFILGSEPQKIGDVQPTLNLGLGMNFSYGNFDLGFTSYGSFGQKVLNATNMMLYDPNRLPTYNVPDDFLGSGITSSPTYSSYWVEDASFFRLQTVTLGYTFPVSGVFSNMRVYLLGENLAVFTDYSGVDPEVSTTGLANPGIDRFNSYPRPTTISFGLNLTLGK